MDPRTDSFAAAAAAEPSRLPPFDAAQELLPSEILWVVDELFRLEVGFSF